MNVPKLRFKEFNDEWNYESLSKYMDRIVAKNKNNESNLVLTISAQYGLVDQTEFFNRNVSSSNLTGYYLLNKGDFAYNKSYSNGYPWGAIKRLNRYNQGVVSSLYICFKPNNKINSNYLEQYFETNKWYQQISEVSVEGARNHGLLNIAVNDFFNTEHFIPQFEEQEKIAKFLSLLDKKIELETKKIEDLKLFKLCINNNLFNGNKTIKLKDICECKSSTISLSDIEYDNGIYPIYGANGVIKKINSYQHDKEYLAIIKDGAGVGKTIICNKKSSIIATLNALIPNDIPVYYFNGLINKIDFSKYIVGSGIPHIYFKDYSNEKLYLHDEKEILLINNLFKKISIKIELEKNKLHLLEALKKGLMQNMFV